MEKTEIKPVLNLIQHLWYIKGYITDKELFNYLNLLVLVGDNPFLDERNLRSIIVNCFAMKDVLRNRYSENKYLDLEFVDKSRLNILWTEEYNRLFSLLGKKRSVHCGSCGNNYTAEVKLIEYAIPEKNVRSGYLYWFGNCRCGLNEYEYVEVKPDE